MRANLEAVARLRGCGAAQNRTPRVGVSDVEGDLCVVRQVVIENPVINSPFREPGRHFKFTDEGITNEVINGRRSSSYFVPIAQPRKKGQKQLVFDTEWTQDRIEENKLVNQIRARVKLWREGGYIGVTPTTSRLLTYWTDPDREKKLFFCQIEALETAIYLSEVAKKYGDAWLENDLRQANDSSNPGLPRTAFKMATGTGKTVVMAMVIAWHTLNKLVNSQDARFSDAFLIVTPGITIRDRLRVLLPNDPQNYYRQRDIVPNQSMDQLGQAKILITNFHALQLREKVAAGKLTKSILAEGETGAFTETPDQMVRRVCRELGTKKQIVILNDEAHHCYRRKPDGEDVKLSGEDRKEAQKREEEARVWISGIEAVKAKIGVKVIYDLSATPFFLRGSGPFSPWSPCLCGEKVVVGWLFVVGGNLRALRALRGERPAAGSRLKRKATAGQQLPRGQPCRVSLLLKAPRTRWLVSARLRRLVRPGLIPGLGGPQHVLHGLRTVRPVQQAELRRPPPTLLLLLVKPRTPFALFTHVPVPRSMSASLSRPNHFSEPYLPGSPAARTASPPRSSKRSE